MKTPYDQYKEVQIQSASPEGLILLLYDGAINFLHHAKKRIEAGNIEGRVYYINRASDIIAELRSSLNLEAGGDLAQRLNELYGYINARLIHANVQQSVAILDEVLGLLGPVRNSWMEVVSAQKKGAEKAAQPETVASLPCALSA
jgi:flagellar protein FliS